MKIHINGKPQELTGTCTVRELLSSQGLANTACAVEINRKVVPHREHAEREVRDGDRIEIVSLVGGG